MFVPYKHDGALQPWEYLPAAAGTYKAGQLLNLSAGKLAAVSAASATTPPYLCMADITAAADEPVPVIRVNDSMIFATELGAAAASAVVGTKLQVHAGGLTVDAAAAGTFEAVSIDGTAAGSAVLGRFK